MTDEEAYNKPLQQRWRMSIQNVKLSDIRIFKDWLSTVEELRNPEDIGVEEMNMQLEDFFQHARTDSLKCIQASISRYLSDGECWLIDTILSTIETYENRTITPISISDNSVQQTVIDLVLIMPNSRIALKYSHTKISREIWQ